MGCDWDDSNLTFGLTSRGMHLAQREKRELLARVCYDTLRLCYLL